MKCIFILYVGGGYPQYKGKYIIHCSFTFDRIFSAKIYFWLGKLSWLILKSVPDSTYCIRLAIAEIGNYLAMLAMGRLVQGGWNWERKFLLIFRCRKPVGLSTWKNQEGKFILGEYSANSQFGQLYFS